VGIVLLTGATGFVGSHLQSRLVAAGFAVRCATRDPDRARGAHPEVEWVELDSNRSETLEPAMRGVQAAVFLIHGMGGGPGYEERESLSAKLFAAAAFRAGLERIVYLGGVEPRGVPSRHLKSRLVTGQILRSGPVPVFELRASMIIGKGSISWQIVRDLAARLPAMLLPRWLATRSQPVAVDDVVDAIVAALILPLDTAGPYDLPGPETLTAKDILFRIAALRGRRPLALSVPILTPRLSSYWLQFVTGADYQVARELVEGLSSDLVASGRDFWTLMPGHRLVSFDDAARRAMAGDEGSPARRTRLFEWAVSIVSRRSDRGPARRGSRT
jgi:uncharacterized protein YbjT (DUF2867 family)